MKFELLTEPYVITHQSDSYSQFASGSNRTFDLNGRGVVASHGINGNSHRCRQVLRLGFFSSAGYFLTLVSTAGGAGAVRHLGGFALGAYRQRGRCEKIMGTPQIFAGFRGLLLGYCHGGFSFMA
jgi:hypothetical protein